MFVCKTVRTCPRLFTQVFVSLKWFASVCKTASVCNLTWFCAQTLFGFGLRLLFSGTCWFLLWWLTMRKSGNSNNEFSRQAAFSCWNSLISLSDTHEFHFTLLTLFCELQSKCVNVFSQSAKLAVFYTHNGQLIIKQWITWHGCFVHVKTNVNAVNCGQNLKIYIWHTLLLKRNKLSYSARIH